MIKFWGHKRIPIRAASILEDRQRRPRADGRMALARGQPFSGSSSPWRAKRMSTPQGNVQVSVTEAFYAKETGRNLHRAALECANLLRRGGYANRLSASLAVREVQISIEVSPVSRNRKWKITTTNHRGAGLPILRLETERPAADGMDKLDFPGEQFISWVAQLVLDALNLLVHTRDAPIPPDALHQLATGGGHTGPSDTIDNQRTEDLDDAEDDDDPGLPPAAPEFAAHFTDPIYRDQADEFAPFGSDEGSDMLAEWSDRRAELADTTLAGFLVKLDMLPDEDTDDGQRAIHTAADEHGIPLPGGDIDRAVITVSAAFTLLYLTGHIDPEGKQTALAAIDTLQTFYDHPDQLTRQRTDVQRWNAR